MSKDSLSHKQSKAVQRSHRARSSLQGTAKRPRLSVHVSLRHVSAQLIDDTKGSTLAYVTTAGAQTKGTMTEKADWAGAQIAKKAQKAKIKSVIFDRGARKYHGRVKQLAEAARAGGLEF